MREVWYVLGFTYDSVIDAWQDARLADAVERVWETAGRPATAAAFWSTSADDYAFRWYLNPAVASLLDAASVTWRDFIIGEADAPPSDARPFVSAGALHRPRDILQ